MAADVIDYSYRILHSYILSNQVAVTDEQGNYFAMLLYICITNENKQVKFHARQTDLCFEISLF
jgi:uncharacterized membrane protein